MSTISVILRAVQRRSGVDFSSYRTPTVERRIRNRMLTLGVTELSDYQRVLEDSAEETQQLIGRITIKVSRFYRNPEVFDTLRTHVLPQLRSLGRPVRIWSAGCGRGEEAYTLAMLLEECATPGTVTATDIDPLALAAARTALYPRDSAADLPDALRQRFLVPLQQGRAQQFGIAPAVQARVLFEQGDLTQPGAQAHGPYDFVCCRNVLIYWSAEKQAQILSMLLASLRGGGVICLGEAEWPQAQPAGLLQAVAPRLRMFRKTAQENCA